MDLPKVLSLEKLKDQTPKDNELLVKIHATTVTAGDCEMRTLTFPFFLGFFIRFYTGLRKPKRLTILGQELAGEVIEIGKGVTRFQKKATSFLGPQATSVLVLMQNTILKAWSTSKNSLRREN